MHVNEEIAPKEITMFAWFLGKVCQCNLIDALQDAWGSTDKHCCTSIWRDYSYFIDQKFPAKTVTVILLDKQCS